ncbi:GNAT family N-acetyltransferase [Halalkalibacter sp. AB-rgal2]|uniref:GNAT family N-acetyltransferase n=1 Tax=Halalkalibacter sp. AB-rgal2 TaxID=3242695 RepID=UPI00359E7414
MSPFSIRKLESTDRSAFIHVMVNAFENDPLLQHVFSQLNHNDKQKKRMVAFFRFIFDQSFLFSEEGWGIFEDERLVGAYIVQSPSKKSNHIGRDTCQLILFAFTLLLKIGFRSFLRLNDYFVSTRKDSMLRYHYLIVIGVSVGMHRRGIGRMMLNHLVDEVKADDKSIGIALDTENTRNVAIYERVGFKMAKVIQSKGLPIYCMKMGMKS